MYRGGRCSKSVIWRCRPHRVRRLPEGSFGQKRRMPACRIQMDNQDVVSGQILVQKQSEKYLVQNLPQSRWCTGSWTRSMRCPIPAAITPVYEPMGGVRCSSPSSRTGVALAGQLLRHPAASGPPGHQPQCRQRSGGGRAHDPWPGFEKGYIHDVGAGLPQLAVMPSCREQMSEGDVHWRQACRRPPPAPPAGGSQRLSEHPAPDQRALRGKEVFIRSGIRFDYLMADPDDIGGAPCFWSAEG